MVASPATDCGRSCLRSCGGEEGSNRPSQYSCLRGWAPTPTSSQPGGDLRHLATHAATAASFNQLLSNWLWLFIGNFIGALIYAALLYVTLTEAGHTAPGVLGDQIRA